MEAQRLHRGRLIDHLQLVVRDLDASRRFYDAVFEVLGVQVQATDHGFSGRTSSSSPRPTAQRRRAS